MLSVRVLVTGAGGQIGKALLRSAPPGAQPIGLTHAELDIGDEGAVADCLERHAVEVIVNAAAYTAVDRAETERELAARVNSLGPANLAAQAARLGARLVHLSTDFVFDGSSSLPYRPESPAHPLNVYGETKRAGEVAVLRALPENSVVLRTAWVYAVDGRNFVRTMLRLMAANRSVRVVCDQVGSPTSARSAARAVWRIIEQPELVGVHHWTDAGVASWYDFAVAIAEEGAGLGLLPEDVVVTPVSTAEYPTPARRPPFSVLDRSSLASLDLEAVHWRRALRSVLRELRDA